MQSKAMQKLYSTLTPEDHNALHGIYRHRCLNDEQLATYFYNQYDDGKNDYTLMRINALIENWFIDPHEYKPGKWGYYLTYRGVQYIRATTDRPLFRVKERSGKRQYEATAGSLRMKDPILDHQSRLNDLALEIIRVCDLDPDCYRDNLFASNFTYAQPDGVLELPNFHIFLEMDMGNEESKILRAKWGHYRNYFLSRDYQLHRQKRIVVLFATEKVKRLTGRRRVTLRSMTDTSLDLLGPMFDCYIGNNEEMICVAKELIGGHSEPYEQAQKILWEKGCKGAMPGKIPGFVQDGELLIQLPNGQPALFLNGFWRPMSLLKRIAYWGRSKADLAGTSFADLRLLALAPGEEEICRDVFSASLALDADISFATLARLQERPLHEAIFIFDQLGNQYHFKDPQLRELVYEKRQYRPSKKRKRKE